MLGPESSGDYTFLKQSQKPRVGGREGSFVSPTAGGTECTTRVRAGTPERHTHGDRGAEGHLPRKD